MYTCIKVPFSILTHIYHYFPIVICKKKRYDKIHSTIKFLLNHNTSYTLSLRIKGISLRMKRILCLLNLLGI